MTGTLSAMWQHWKGRTIGDSTNIASGMLICAILLFLADVYFSLSMYRSIPESELDKDIYGAVSVVFAVVILLLSGAIPHLFRAASIGALIGCILASVAVYYLLAMSLSSSFGNTATIVHQKEQVLLQNSNEMQAAQARLEAGQVKLDSLSRYADSSKAEGYERELAELEQSAPIPPIMPAHLARWMNADCSPKTDRRGQPYTTRAAEACPEWQAMSAQYQAEKATHDAEVAEARSYVQGHSDYLSQQQHTASLKTEVAAVGSGKDATASGTLPMYLGLSKVDLAIRHYGTSNPESIKNAFIARFVILVSLLQPLLVFLSQALPRKSGTARILEAEYRNLSEQEELARLELAKRKQQERLAAMNAQGPQEQQPALAFNGMNAYTFNPANFPQA